MVGFVFSCKSHTINFKAFIQLESSIRESKLEIVFNIRQVFSFWIHTVGEAMDSFNYGLRDKLHQTLHFCWLHPLHQVQVKEIALWLEEIRKRSHLGLLSRNVESVK